MHDIVIVGRPWATARAGRGAVACTCMTVIRMWLIMAQPQATERHNKYTMHMHNTAKGTLCTTHTRIVVRRSQSHTAYMDTAHWSSTPCKVLQDEMALTDEKHSRCLARHNLVPSLFALKTSIHMTSDFNTGIVSQAMIQLMASTNETFLPCSSPSILAVAIEGVECPVCGYLSFVNPFRINTWCKNLQCDMDKVIATVGVLSGSHSQSCTTLLLAHNIIVATMRWNTVHMQCCHGCPCS